MTIHHIIAASVSHYPDTGELLAYVHWADAHGETGCTSGSPDNLHIEALLNRAEREGVLILATKGAN